MNQSALRRQRRLRELIEARRKLRVRAAGRAQIGLDADRLERVVVRKRSRNVRVGGAARMDDGKIAPDRRGEIHVHDPGEKLRLPQRMVLGREIVHREPARLRILAEDARNGVRQPARDRAHVSRLGRVAFDRRLPQRCDLEPRQRALDAEASPARLDKRDVRRHPAGQRREAGRFSGFQETHAAQGLDQIAGLDERRLVHSRPLRPMRLNRWRGRPRDRTPRRS